MYVSINTIQQQTGCRRLKDFLLGQIVLILAAILWMKDLPGLCVTEMTVLAYTHSTEVILIFFFFFRK